MGPANELTPTVATPLQETHSANSRHRQTLAVALGAIVVVTGTLAGILLSAPSRPGRHVATPRARTTRRPSQIPSYEELPKLVGLTVAAAETRLSHIGLRWHLNVVASPSVTAAGTVLGEKPVYPDTVRRGDIVSLSVGKPYPTAAVPNVSGPHESEQAARAALVRAGFTPKTNFVGATNVGQLAFKGDVLSQKPTAGSVTAKNSIVTINVVRGAALVTVPGTVLGETPARAGATLAGAQLSVGTTESGFSSTVRAGDVASTYPGTGESVTVGSTVNLVISTGPAAVVPDLRGDTVVEAERALRRAGLVLGRVNPTIGPNGLVVAQAAKPGRELAHGTSITIAVGTSPVGNPATTPAAGTVRVVNDDKRCHRTHRQIDGSGGRVEHHRLELKSWLVT